MKRKKRNLLITRNSCQVQKFSAFIFSLLFMQLTMNSHAQDVEVYTHRLEASNSNFDLWTCPPSERIFKDSPLPEASDQEIKVYAAANESEPFLLVIKGKNNATVQVTAPVFTNGVEVELFQVKYVNISKATDALGKTGDYPDPLFPIANNSKITIKKNENTAIWCNIKVPKGMLSNDYSGIIVINDVSINIKLHVFNFSIPEKLNVKSQMNFSHKTILDKYGVTGTGDEYWMYVDKMKQWFIDHRLTPKSVLWSGGLTGSGASPYIDYDCAGNFSDPHGIWGFEEPALRYLKGTGLMKGKFTSKFNNSAGFPSFMCATFRNNDAGSDQRPDKFCNINRSAGDWMGSTSTSYNTKWFAYMKAMQNYLTDQQLLDKAYYYFANEPQNQEDYDAVAWYAKSLKEAAPNLKLMVSEEPKEEIFNNSKYPGAKIDIWLPVLQNFEPSVSHEREKKYGEESWVYFLHSTRPPYFNPITLDHPGIESKLTGWFLWKYRIRGIAYYALNSWSKNPYTNPMTTNHNGDTFLFYPPSENNTAISYGATDHRFVSSVRFELMRDALEDYEYLYRLNASQLPVVDAENDADAQVDKIIGNLTSYTRDSEFMYNLRRLIGLKIGGEITSIPDIQPDNGHPRTQTDPKDYYINFQSLADNPQTTSTDNNYKYYSYEGKDYLQVDGTKYDDELGYGWYAPNDVNWMGKYDQWFENKNDLQRSCLYSDWGRRATFNFDLPNGEYNVAVSIGHRGTYKKQYVSVEGTVFFEEATTSNSCSEVTKRIRISDKQLNLEMGAPSNKEYTMLNYMTIIATENNGGDGTTAISSVLERKISAYYSPTEDGIVILNKDTKPLDIQLLDMLGKKLGSLRMQTERTIWKPQNSGVHLIRIVGEETLDIKVLVP